MSLNLTSSKENAFKEIYRVLKPGGHLYFSDVFADSRIPEQYLEDEILLGECLSGALSIEDFTQLTKAIFNNTYSEISSSNIELKDTEIKEKLKGINFFSKTISIFKPPQC